MVILMILMMTLMLMVHADTGDNARDIDAGAETCAAEFDVEINADVELVLTTGQ